MVTILSILFVSLSGYLSYTSKIFWKIYKAAFDNNFFKQVNPKKYQKTEVSVFSSKLFLTIICFILGYVLKSKFFLFYFLISSVLSCTIFVLCENNKVFVYLSIIVMEFCPLLDDELLTDYET